MGMELYEASEQAADLTLANSGGTFDRDLGPVDLTSGYAVAVKSFGRGNGALASRSYVAERLRAAAFGGPGDYIGTWAEVNRFGHTVVYIDRVVVLPDLESALILARSFNQLAIYDFATKESIYV